MKVKNRDIKRNILETFNEKEVFLEGNDMVKKVVLHARGRRQSQYSIRKGIEVFIGFSVEDYFESQKIPASEIVGATIEITLSNSTNTLLDAEVIVEVKTFNGTYLDEVIPAIEELEILSDIAYDMQIDECSWFSTQTKRLGKHLN